MSEIVVYIMELTIFGILVHLLGPLTVTGAVDVLVSKKSVSSHAHRKTEKKFNEKY